MKGLQRKGRIPAEVLDERSRAEHRQTQGGCRTEREVAQPRTGIRQNTALLAAVPVGSSVTCTTQGTSAHLGFHFWFTHKLPSEDPAVGERDPQAGRPTLARIVFP